MIDHIYGKINLITDPLRPIFFIKELSINIDYFISKFEESIKPFQLQTESFLKTYSTNLFAGIKYYKKIIPEIFGRNREVKQKIERRIGSSLNLNYYLYSCVPVDLIIEKRTTLSFQNEGLILK